jgi:hypothetical protein
MILSFVKKQFVPYFSFFSKSLNHPTVVPIRYIFPKSNLPNLYRKNTKNPIKDSFVKKVPCFWLRNSIIGIIAFFPCNLQCTSALWTVSYLSQLSLMAFFCSYGILCVHLNVSSKLALKSRLWTHHGSAI